MPQIIDVPGQGKVEFPDGMTDAQIVSAIRKNSMAPVEAPGFWDRMKMAAQSSSIAGGPLNMIGREGMNQLNQLTDKLAYGVGGKVTDLLAGKVSPEVAAGAGYAANLGTNLASAYALGNAGAAAGSPLLEAGAKRTMQAAIKPGISDLMSGKASRAIDTLLKEDVSPSTEGLAKLQTEISRLNDEIAQNIKNSPAMINKAAVGQRLKDALDKFQLQVNPNSDTQAIKQAWLEFRNHPLLAGQTEFPVQLAQSLKQGTYQSLGDKAYGEVGSASTAGQKALARGLKEEIAKAVPAIAPLNARESDLLNAIKVSQRRALLDSNKNVLGLAPVAPNVGSMLTFLADRSPTMASYLARILYSNSGVLPGGAVNAAALPILMQNAKAPALSQP